MGILEIKQRELVKWSEQRVSTVVMLLRKSSSEIKKKYLLHISIGHCEICFKGDGHCEVCFKGDGD